MAAPETQNPNADNAPSEQAGTVGVFAHDWITYLMVLGAVCIIVGVPLVLLGDAWNRSTMGPDRCRLLHRLCRRLDGHFRVFHMESG